MTGRIRISRRKQRSPARLALRFLALCAAGAVLAVHVLIASGIVPEVGLDSTSAAAAAVAQPQHYRFGQPPRTLAGRIEDFATEWGRTSVVGIIVLGIAFVAYLIFVVPPDEPDEVYDDFDEAAHASSEKVIFNVFDHVALKRGIDEGLCAGLGELGFAEDNFMNDVKIAVLVVACSISLFAQLYPVKYPDNLLVMRICVWSFVTLSCGVLVGAVCARRGLDLREQAQTARGRA